LDLFKQVKKVKETQGKHVNVFCSFLQIYNERVYDLLNPDSTPFSGEGDEIDMRDGRTK
jgi:Kinesin motor domain